MPFSKIILASDHGGISLKSQIKSYLEARDLELLDLGPFDDTSVDYPDFGEKAALEMKKHSDAAAIVICGSGIGISIAANRHSWIRCALVHDVTTAQLCREHNDANMIALGERVLGINTALACVESFLNTSFEGGRHERRVEKLTNLPN